MQTRRPCEDWDAVTDLGRQKVITVDALVLVSRDLDGKIHVEDDAHKAGIGAARRWIRWNGHLGKPSPAHQLLHRQQIN